jgi:hypothetical protein
VGIEWRINRNCFWLLLVYTIHKIESSANVKEKCWKLRFQKITKIRAQFFFLYSSRTWKIHHYNDLLNSFTLFYLRPNLYINSNIFILHKKNFYLTRFLLFNFFPSLRIIIYIYLEQQHILISYTSWWRKQRTKLRCTQANELATAKTDIF